MTPADLLAIRSLAVELAETVRGARVVPLLLRARIAADAAEVQVNLNILFITEIEFLSMRLAALESEKSGGSSTNEVQDGERGQGKSNLPVL